VWDIEYVIFVLNMHLTLKFTLGVDASLVEEFLPI
jgi:hypothetical protein